MPELRSLISDAEGLPAMRSRLKVRASLFREPEIRLPEADWNRSGMSDSGATRSARKRFRDYNLWRADASALSRVAQIDRNRPGHWAARADGYRRARVAPRYHALQNV